MKRCWNTLRLPLALTLLGLNGCSSSVPVSQLAPIHVLEQDALYALELNMPVEAAYALDGALEKYQSIDDLAGQWRIRYAMASIAFRNEDLSEATVQVDVLEEIAEQLNSAAISYKTYLMLGRTRHDAQYYHRALSVASSSIQRAVAQAYLGRTHQAVQLLDGTITDEPGDRGFVYYQHALETDSSAYFRLSLEAYRSAEDSRGVADALVSLARLEHSNNKPQQAQTYARRAVRVLQSAGDNERAETIEAWLSTL